MTLDLTPYRRPFLRLLFLLLSIPMGVEADPVDSNRPEDKGLSSPINSGVARPDAHRPPATGGQPFQCAERLAEIEGDGQPRPKEISTFVQGHLQGLAIFVGFAGEEDRPPPAYAADLFDPDRPGSFSHFFRTMSFGQLLIEGTALPRRYVTDHPTAYYTAHDPQQPFAPFVREILKQVDGEVDFTPFDADRDGYVDVLFVNLTRMPRGFLRGSATGIARLGLAEDFLTDDGVRIRADQHGDGPGGSIQEVRDFAHAVGSMSHEFGHLLGLPDLYSTAFLSAPDQEPEKDSAGIGRWGLMGYGSLGWNGDDGPSSLCAWSREQLGWIGPHNERLVEVQQDMEDVRIAALATGGQAFRLSFPWGEYFLLENRQASEGHYDRHIPRSGLLIWHIAPSGSNSVESRKRVDLESADGLFTDRGYPLGQVPDAVGGRDNLDFWAHGGEYREIHAGNLGDPTDVFDGTRYTEFSRATNPSSADYAGFSERGLRGVAVENIRREGPVMIADLFPLDELLIEYEPVDRGPSILVSELSSWGNGDGQVAPGELISLEIQLTNLTPRPFLSLRVSARIDDPELELSDRMADLDLLGEGELFLPGRSTKKARLGVLMIPSEYPPGHRIPVHLEISNGEQVWNDTLSIQVEGSDAMPPHPFSLSVTPKKGSIGTPRKIEAWILEGSDRIDAVVEIFRASDGSPIDSVPLAEEARKRNRLTGERFFTGRWTPPAASDFYVTLSVADARDNRHSSLPWLGFTSAPFTPSTSLLRVEHLAPTEEDQVEDALAAGGWSGDLWNSYYRGPVDRGILLSYARNGVLLWSSPEEEDAEEGLRTYLDAGGRLLIAGESLLYGGESTRLFSPAFARQYLHAEAAGFSKEGWLDGVEGDPVSGGLRIGALEPTVRGVYRTLLAYGFRPCTCGGMTDIDLQGLAPGASPPDPSLVPEELICTCSCGGFNVSGGEMAFFTDLMTPLPRAFPLFTPSRGPTAGLRVDSGTFRVVYTGFRLQAIKNREARVALISRAMDWLLSSPTAVEETRSGKPSSYALHQNFPNPFNGQTLLQYELPEAGPVRIEVFNILGQRQTLLIDQPQPAGWHQVAWDGSGEAGSASTSGIYICRMRAGGSTTIRRMVLLK